ncbi:MAG: OsmC family protein [Casimicrobiaceae bacterium]
MMHYAAEVLWQRGDQPFVDNRYSRKHVLRFDGGTQVAGSSSPHVVPVPMSDPAAVDPEEAFVGSLSSCHMLWFLSLAAKRKFRVDSYRDCATGEMEKNAAGKLAIARVTLRPAVDFSGSNLPTNADIDALHHTAHEECFIANSVRTEIRCEPVYPEMGTARV